MTAPAPQPSPTARTASGTGRPVPPWWARPSIVLPGVAALAFVAALFSPVRVGPRGGDPRLSTLSREPLGAAVLHDLAARLDWRVARHLHPGMPSAPGAIIAVLDPAIPLRVGETHALLQHVRDGGAALVVLGRGNASLMDSLHLDFAIAGAAMPVEPAARSCPTSRTRAFTSLWYGGTPTMLTVRWTAPAPGPVTTFLAVSVDESDAKQRLESSLIGFPYGAGRLVVAADPDVFRNDAMRDCPLGFDIAAVRALEFLAGDAPDARRTIVFDEYHQGHGARPGSIRAAALYLGMSPSGRLLAQLALAGLMLLAALAPRTVRPREETRVERRDPLEQVEALARAYEQVRATRTAAERLVRGVRRRTDRGALRDRAALTDDAWLARVADRTPALAEEVALARRALSESLPHRTFATLGPALHRIEATLTRT